MSAEEYVKQRTQMLQELEEVAERIAAATTVMKSNPDYQLMLRLKAMLNAHPGAQRIIALEVMSLSDN